MNLSRQCTGTAAVATQFRIYYLAYLCIAQLFLNIILSTGSWNLNRPSPVPTELSFNFSSPPFLTFPFPFCHPAVALIHTGGTLCKCRISYNLHYNLHSRAFTHLPVSLRLLCFLLRVKLFVYDEFTRCG